jgi:hypothetical protein
MCLVQRPEVSGQFVPDVIMQMLHDAAIAAIAKATSVMKILI